MEEKNVISKEKVEEVLKNFKECLILTKSCELSNVSFHDFNDLLNEDLNLREKIEQIQELNNIIMEEKFLERLLNGVATEEGFIRFPNDRALLDIIKNRNTKYWVKNKNKVEDKVNNIEEIDKQIKDLLSKYFKK